MLLTSLVLLVEVHDHALAPDHGAAADIKIAIDDQLHQQSCRVLSLQGGTATSMPSDAALITPMIAGGWRQP